MEDNVEAAGRELYKLACMKPRTPIILRAITGKLCAVMQVAQQAQDHGEAMFHYPGFIDGVVKIITDSDNYRILDDTLTGDLGKESVDGVNYDFFVSGLPIFLRVAECMRFIDHVVHGDPHLYVLHLLKR